MSLSGLTVIMINRTPFLYSATAAHDLMKIVRAEYGKIPYMKLTFEPMRLWRMNPLYQQLYQTGVISACSEEIITQNSENYHISGK